MDNPFTILENKITNLEKMVEQLLARTNAPPPNDDVVGGINMASEVTGLKKATIYCKIGKKEIPHFKKGGKIYFSKKSLLDWLTADAINVAEKKEEPLLFPRYSKRKKVSAASTVRIPKCKQLINSDSQIF